MLSLKDYVTPVGQKFPVGIIQSINGNNTATVLWGISDNKEYSEDVQMHKLQLVNTGPIGEG